MLNGVDIELGDRLAVRLGGVFGMVVGFYFGDKVAFA